MLEGGWGEAGGWMPLPTRPQRYCDPASLVTLFVRAPILKMTKAQWNAKSDEEKSNMKSKFEVPDDEEFKWIPPAPSVLTPAALLGLWLHYYDLHDDPPPVLPDEPLQNLSG